jgi:hypothetical protein
LELDAKAVGDATAERRKTGMKRDCDYEAEEEKEEDLPSGALKPVTPSQTLFYRGVIDVLPVTNPSQTGHVTRHKEQTLKRRNAEMLKC